MACAGFLSVPQFGVGAKGLDRVQGSLTDTASAQTVVDKTDPRDGETDRKSRVLI